MRGKIVMRCGIILDKRLSKKQAADIAGSEGDSRKKANLGAKAQKYARHETRGDPGLKPRAIWIVARCQGEGTERDGGGKVESWGGSSESVRNAARLPNEQFDK
jgi:hypothetical protein